MDYAGLPVTSGESQTEGVRRNRGVCDGDQGKTFPCQVSFVDKGKEQTRTQVSFRIARKPGAIRKLWSGMERERAQTVLASPITSVHTSCGFPTLLTHFSTVGLNCPPVRRLSSICCVRAGQARPLSGVKLSCSASISGKASVGTGIWFSVVQIPAGGEMVSMNPKPARGSWPETRVFTIAY
jgi:hypothetical protein